jgi:hypothetical protein
LRRLSPAGKGGERESVGAPGLGGPADRRAHALIALEPDPADVAREHRELLDVMLHGEPTPG